jgi:hypothetical protein
VRNRTLGIIIIIDLVLLVLWLVTMIALMVTRGPIETFEQALDFATERHWLFYRVTYTNAVLFTILNVVEFAGLYALLRPDYPLWAAIGFAFAPIYGLIALLSYLSQIVVIPPLVELYAIPEYRATATVLLRHLVQIWPESSLQYIDQFSYVLLGIPSFIYGVALYRYGGRMRVPGGLLALGGPFTLMICIGVLGQFPSLVTVASMVAGVLSIAAFVPLGVNLLRGEASRTGRG